MTAGSRSCGSKLAPTCRTEALEASKFDLALLFCCMISTFAVLVLHPATTRRYPTLLVLHRLRPARYHNAASTLSDDTMDKYGKQFGSRSGHWSRSLVIAQENPYGAEIASHRVDNYSIYRTHIYTPTPRAAVQRVTRCL